MFRVWAQQQVVQVALLNRTASPRRRTPPPPQPQQQQPQQSQPVSRLLCAKLQDVLQLGPKRQLNAARYAP